MRTPRYPTFLELQAQQTDECILWPYGRSRGYGTVNDPNSRKELSYVHRISCTISHGEPPTPKHIAAHSCPNKHCLNPRHLRWATHSENQHDSVLAGTSNAALTADQVQTIRRHPNADTATVARFYGVRPLTIENVLTGKTWAWLP